MDNGKWITEISLFYPLTVFRFFIFASVCQTNPKLGDTKIQNFWALKSNDLRPENRRVLIPRFDAAKRYKVAGFPRPERGNPARRA